MVPSDWIARLFKEPAAAPFWLLAVTSLGLAKPLTLGRPREFKSLKLIAEPSVAPFAICGNVTPVSGSVISANAGGVAGSAPSQADVILPAESNKSVPAVGEPASTVPVIRL